MLEKHIQEQILTYLNLQPHCLAFAVKTTGFFDTKRGVFRKNTSKFVIKGTSDIIGSWKGRPLCIEVKTVKGYTKYMKNPTEHELNQRAFLETAQSKGWIALIVCSLDTVIETLKKF